MKKFEIYKSHQNKFDFIEEEIEIRVESLKTYLDKLREKVHNSIDQLREHLTHNRPVISSSSNFKHSVKYLLLNPANSRRNDALQLAAPNRIGKLAWKLTEAEFLSLKADVIDLSTHAKYPIWACSLQYENQLAIVDYPTGNVSIFDRYFKLTRKLTNETNLGGLISRPVRIDSNGRNTLFILDKFDFKIYLIDVTSCAIQHLDQHTYKDLSFSTYSDKLYAQDKTDNSLVRIFSSTGMYTDQIRLQSSQDETTSNFNLNKTSCLNLTDKYAILLHDLNEFKVFNLKDGMLVYSLKARTNERIESYCVLDDLGLIYFNEERKLKFRRLSDDVEPVKDQPVNFDLNSNTAESCLNCDLFKVYDSNSIVYFNKKFIVCCPWKQKLIILS